VEKTTHRTLQPDPHPRTRSTSHHRAQSQRNIRRPTTRTWIELDELLSPAFASCQDLLQTTITKLSIPSLKNHCSQVESRAFSKWINHSMGPRNAVEVRS